jgi:hypothetical protein
LGVAKGIVQFIIKFLIYQVNYFKDFITPACRLPDPYIIFKSHEKCASYSLNDQARFKDLKKYANTITSVGTILRST